MVFWRTKHTYFSKIIIAYIKVSPQTDVLSSLWRMGCLWEEENWDISLIPLLPNPGEFRIFPLLECSSSSFLQFFYFFSFLKFFFCKIVAEIPWSSDSKDRSCFTSQADKCIYQYIHEQNKWSRTKKGGRRKTTVIFIMWYFLVLKRHIYLH